MLVVPGLVRNGVGSRATCVIGGGAYGAGDQTEGSVCTRNALPLDPSFNPDLIR